MMRLKKFRIHSMAVVGMAALFVAATVAEAGLTGASRLRPGKGFHNRSNNNATVQSRSWQQSQYVAPRVVQSVPQQAPVYRSAPTNVVQPQRVAPRTVYRPSWFGGRLFR